LAVCQGLFEKIFRCGAPFPAPDRPPGGPKGYPLSAVCRELLKSRLAKSGDIPYNLIIKTHIHAERMAGHMREENLKIGQKLKRIRRSQRLTLSEVSARLGCSSPFLSMVENGRTGISLPNLQRLLEIYGCTMADLVENGSTDRVVHAAEAKRLGNERAVDGVEAFLLVHNPQEKQIEPILFHLQPGATLGPLQHCGEEFCYVIKGYFEVTLQDEVGTREIYHLDPGDTIYYASSMQHTWRNTSTTEPGVFLGAVTPPSF